jgi:hypothetical protein
LDGKRPALFDAIFRRGVRHPNGWLRGRLRLRLRRSARAQQYGGEGETDSELRDFRHGESPG